MRTHYDTLTEEQYLVREPEAAYKSEFRDGLVVAMSGATVPHGQITVNLTRIISAQLVDRPCQALSSDVRIKVAAARFYTYPDLSVVCGVPVVDAKDKCAITNPTLIVEVLSDSTEDYDRNEKFAYYKKLPSLREYLLVAQDRMEVERRSKQKNGRWKTEVYTSADDIVALPAIECEVAMRDIYHKFSMY
jgi:Uma2 family endonuclease